MIWPRLGIATPEPGATEYWNLLDRLNDFVEKQHGDEVLTLWGIEYFLSHPHFQSRPGQFSASYQGMKVMYLYKSVLMNESRSFHLGMDIRKHNNILSICTFGDTECTCNLEFNFVNWGGGGSPSALILIVDFAVSPLRSGSLPGRDVSTRLQARKSSQAQPRTCADDVPSSSADQGNVRQILPE